MLFNYRQPVPVRPESESVYLIRAREVPALYSPLRKTGYITRTAPDRGSGTGVV